MKIKELIIASVLALALTGCGDVAKPAHNVGDIVISVVEAREGQIIQTKCNFADCIYLINFWTKAGFDTDWMRAYEFKRK